MANRKFLIENILGLAQKLGANPNKFMGTKSNINFLGTGDRGMKGTTFSGQLNEDFLDLGFGKSDLVKIIEQDAGYVTAGKLNDVQLNTMFNNLKMIDETFNPPPGPLNVIDLETGTRGLNKQGLESLRETDKIKRFTQGLGTSKTAMSNKIKEGIETLKNKLTGGADDVATKAKSEEDFIRSGAADFSDYVSAEGGRRAVVRQLMTREPNFFQLPPEVAESIAKSKDLGKGGSSAPDPLVVFRNVGNFTDDEFARIDQIIESNPFDDVKNIADKVSEYIKLIRPEGFRPGFKSGKSVKDGIAALLKLGNKKFGKDTIKTADEIEPSEFAKFNERNKLLDDADVEMYAEDLGDPETWYEYGMTIREADNLIKNQKAYEAQMFTDYKAGRLDPKPGESGRKKFLEKKAEEAEMSGDSRLFTPDEADELTAMQQYGGPQTDDYYRQSLQIEVNKLPIEELTPEALKVKFPGMPDKMAQMVGNDTNLQRKAEAIATIEQAFLLKDSGKSIDEIIATFNAEPKSKMKKGGLAQILEM